MSFSKILNLAEQMERTGVSTYRRFAEMADDPAVAALFGELADQEIEHGRTFRDMREQFEADKASGGGLSADQNKRLEKVLAEADRRNLGAVLQDNFPVISVEELLHRAIGLEKSVIAFFSDTRSALKDDRGREAIDRIIAEEMTHIDWLNAKLHG
ncbi:MAG: ferritin family protein [Planctomycetes bacterium]|nr:ferritin family protein [Planctomycetota bacterium]